MVGKGGRGSSPGFGVRAQVAERQWGLPIPGQCWCAKPSAAPLPMRPAPEGWRDWNLLGLARRVQVGVFPLGATGGVGFLCFSSKQRSQLCTWGAAKGRQLGEPRMQQALLVPGRNSQGAVGWHRAAQTWRGAVWAWGNEHQWEQQLEGSRSFAKRNSGGELGTGGTGGPLHLGVKRPGCSHSRTLSHACCPRQAALIQSPHLLAQKTGCPYNPLLATQSR